METRTLGNSDLQITPIGIGAWAIGGGGWQFGWGSQDDQDSIGAIQAALDGGINWIDTAPAYGLGRSEEVVARALAGRADRPYIFTKCSIRWREDRSIYRTLKAASVREECENSLRRLNVDVIDLYQMHWPIPDEEVEEGWTEMAKLQQEGKVRWIGVSNFNVGQLKRAQEIAPVTSLQPPYNLLRRGIEAEVLPSVQSQNIGVIIYSPMQAGLLSGKMTRERIARFEDDDWRKDSDFFKEPQLSRNLALAEKLREIGSRHGRTPGEVAIAWTLNNPAVTGAIVGVRRPDQVPGVIGSAEFRLTPDEVKEIEEFPA
jgi:aryl-alcohol dehydrogenase-like predicted oxidoreductase